MINTVAKFIRKVFIPRSEFLDDEVERSIDNEKVDCKELEPPYLGVPAPVMMPIDEWFTDSNIEPVKTEKQITHEEMLEEAARREKENQVLDIAKNIMEENKEAFQHLAAIERKEFAEKDFKDLTREQKIQLALEEIDWIVIGGQDGEEFYGSIQFLRQVLRSLA